MINTLLGRNSKSTDVSELLINNTIISDDKRIAESFNEYFTNIETKLAAESNVSNSKPCDDPMTDECPGHFPGIRFRSPDISVSNVVTSLKNLKVSKATGMDYMPAKALKMTVHILAPSLTAIFNLSLNTGLAKTKQEFFFVSSFLELHACAWAMILCLCL